MRTIVATLCVAICFFACKKDSEPQSKKTLLTKGAWHVSAYTVDPAIDFDGDGTDETNVYAVMDQCIKDDHTTFFTDGKAELDEGATKCNANDPQTMSLTWSMNQDETQLEVQGIEYMIESLTESNMVLKEIEVISAVTVTHTVTFSH
jgi:hypothetical protein